MPVFLARRSPVLRRLRTAVVGVVTAAVLSTACSSSGNGKAFPATSQAGSTTPSSTTSAAPSVGTSGVTSAGLPSSTTSAASGGAASSQFCKDFSQAGLSGLPTNTDKASLTNSAKLFAKAAADAPPEIKSDVQLISDFLNTYVSGHPDPTKIAKVEPALERVVKYTTAHCSGG